MARDFNQDEQNKDELDAVFQRLSSSDPFHSLEAARRINEVHPDSNPELYPLSLQLKQVPRYVQLYNALFPVTGVQKLSMKYGRFHLTRHRGIEGKSDWLARGSYKNVFRVPENYVIKVSRNIRLSDPICGSVYRDVNDNRYRYLMLDELEALERLESRGSSWSKHRIEMAFNRLGMERYYYEKVKEALPDLVVPTNFFMGIEYRKIPFTGFHYETLTPMDEQKLLPGKHLKEFAYAKKKDLWKEWISPMDWTGSPDRNESYGFQFENAGRLKKKIIKKITEDFRRLIRFTEKLALEEKLILDIHSENIIITLPEFSVRVFDFHMFDEHLYDPDHKDEKPGKEHIEMIELFLDTLQKLKKDK